MSYEFSTVADIRAGAGTIVDLGRIAAGLNIRHVFVVTDAGIQAHGLLDDGIASLADHDIRVTLFTEVESDPADTTVNTATQALTRSGCDGVIGFGGGSAMDVAKLVAALASGEQTLDDMYGVDQISGGRLPLIQVPTTSGTGSEVTMVSIVTTGATTKSGVVSRVLLADAVILDPQLTLGLPAHITAATGIDAMVHAIEAYTSARLKNPISDALALAALTRLSGSIVTAVKNGHDLQARTDMQLGAMMAGQAFANAPVGGVHALAYPVGGIFHVPHGLSNSLVLPHVLRYNDSAAHHLYAELAPVILSGTDVHKKSTQHASLADHFLELAATLDLPVRLRDVDIPRSALKDLAQSAMLQQRLLINNPREIDQQAALALYEQAW